MFVFLRAVCVWPTASVTAPHSGASVPLGKMLSHVLQGEGRDSGQTLGVVTAEEETKYRRALRHDCDPAAAPEPDNLDPASVRVILLQIHMRHAQA